jgi:hypothetical protein
MLDEALAYDLIDSRFDKAAYVTFYPDLAVTITLTPRCIM